MASRVSSHLNRGMFLGAFLLLCVPVIQAGAVGRINVVAAENFYGNIVSQIGGDRVYVTSILSDPNVDPHEYESSVEDARATGGGGPCHGEQRRLRRLDGQAALGVTKVRRRVLLKGFDIAPTKLPDNEHIWYNVDNVQAVAQAVTESLKNWIR